jgi:UDP-N-acetyl-2-amino-2-deoxyglucuronate dehydrogenase
MTVKTFALIGCGRISLSHVKSALARNLSIVGLCDTDVERAYIIKDSFGLKDSSVYSNYNEMISKLKPDIVAVATPSGQHYQILINLINQKINLIIIEKPLSLSLNEIDEVIFHSILFKNNITVCHQNRFNLAVQKLYYSIQNDNLGKLFYGVATIRWNRNQSYYDQADWRGKWKSDGGALMNQSIHNIDLLLWMMDSPVVEVFGYIDNKNHPSIEVEDMGVALLKFANGAFGIIESSMNTYPENFEETLSIFGEKGSVILGGKSVNKIVHWNVKDDPNEDLEKFNEEVDSVYGNGHIALYKNFIEAIEQDREPAITLQDGRNAVEVILAIYLSSFEKRPVQLPLPADTSTIVFEDFKFDK